MNAWLELLYNLRTLLTNGQFPEWGYWSYLVLAVLVVFEGPIATLLGAAAAAAGVMRPGWVFLAASGGNLLADTLWYLIGYIGKIEWFFSLGQRMGLKPNQMERLQKNMRNHAAKVLFFAKLSLGLMVPSLIAAGLVRARWLRWFPAVFGGEIIWTGSLVLIGYYATASIKRVEQGLEYLILGCAIAFVIFIFVLSRRIMRENEMDDDKPDNTHA